MVAVIPQRPELFAASLRFNVDPLKAHTDAELCGALCQVGLAPLLGLDHQGRGDGGKGLLSGGLPPSSEAVTAALSMSISDGGSSLSEGEKQLISLARALLRRTPIVVVDEATANVDYVTDRLVQTMLKEHERFASATVLSIAHRLSTILESDKLLVLNAGKVVAFAPPAELLGAGGGGGGGGKGPLRETREVKEAFRKLLQREVLV